MSLCVDITHRVGDFTLNSAFDAPPGVTALFGRSGAGKTTLVDVVAGLVQPQSGRVVIDGVTVLDTASGICLPAHRRRLGYVFQDARLFPHLDVRQNLAYGARFSPVGAPGPEQSEVIELLGLSKLLHRQPNLLSGGEKQRVAIGRAVLARPRMLLMDEPLASLDEQRKSDILPYLERLRSAFDLPVLYVSHALDEIARLADTLVLLQDGTVRAAGPLHDILADPVHLPVLGVREAGAVIDATVGAHAPDGLTTLHSAAGDLFLPGVRAAIGTRVRVRVRAADIIISRDRPLGLSSLNILPVTIRDVHLGDGPGAALALDANGLSLIARITARSVKSLQLAPGVSCFAVLKATSVASTAIGQP